MGSNPKQTELILQLGSSLVQVVHGGEVQTDPGLLAVLFAACSGSMGNGKE